MDAAAKPRPITSADQTFTRSTALSTRAHGISAALKASSEVGTRPSAMAGVSTTCLMVATSSTAWNTASGSMASDAAVKQAMNGALRADEPRGHLEDHRERQSNQGHQQEPLGDAGHQPIRWACSMASSISRSLALANSPPIDSLAMTARRRVDLQRDRRPRRAERRATRTAPPPPTVEPRWPWESPQRDQ